MATIDDFRDDRDMVAKLKAANTILRTPSTNVIERYAAISQLALSKRVEKVEVLTLGLLDSNLQVRLLAATALEDYGLRETSAAVLDLLKNGKAGLRYIFDSPERVKIVELLGKIRKLFLESRVALVEGKAVDYQKRHGLLILRELNQWSKLSEDEDKENNEIDRYPLRSLLSGQDAQGIPELIEEMLEESKDVFCRIGAILALGEIGIDLREDEGTFTFNLIRGAIDREENRDDYRVTWRGLQALTALVQQYPDKAELFYQDLRTFFNERTYHLGDKDIEETHRYYLRRQCIDALHTLHAYEELKTLIDDGNRGQNPYLPMMRINKDINAKIQVCKNAIRNVKRAIIETFLDIYIYESRQSPHELTERQRDILKYMRDWVGSQDLVVRQHAVECFSHLPQVTQAVSSLLMSTRETDDEIANRLGKLQNGNASLENLLENRRQFAIALGTLCTSKELSAAILAQDEADQSPAQQEPSYDVLPAEIREKVLALLRSWCLYPRIPGDDGQEISKSRRARLESLWTLYDLSLVDSSTSDLDKGLSLDEVTQLLQDETYVPIKCVLHLFHARHADEHGKELQHIARTMSYDSLIRVCAEIEALIKQPGPDISEDALRLVPDALGGATEIHPSLAVRFMPVLAGMEGAKATELIGLLLEDNRLARLLMKPLREALCDYQCYQHRNLFANSLFQNLFRRHIEMARMRLRWDFLNLYRSGIYQPDHLKEHLDFQMGQLSGTEKRVLAALQDVQENFEEYTLPILSPQQSEYVVALEHLSPDIATTLLYAHTIDEQSPRKAVVRAYLRSDRFVRRSLFLDRAMTDRETTEQIKANIKTPAEILSPTGTRFTGLHLPLVGRVTHVEDEGIYVDVGLWRYQPFVSRMEMLGARQMDALDEWHRYADDLLGSRILFYVKTITFITGKDGETIEAMELSRDISDRDFVDSLLKNSPDKTIDARIQSVDATNLQVIFYAYGRDIPIPLHLLSWRNQENWILREWTSEFEKRIGRSLALRYIDDDQNSRNHHWSLRDNKANFENFVQLFYEQGADQFQLTYIQAIEDRNTGDGYVFEISPGRNCYIPADRLIEGHSGDQDIHFLFPDPTIKPGYELLVRFVERTIHNEKLILLNVEGKQASATNRWSQGTKIEGLLQNLNRASGTGNLQAFDEELQDFTIAISDLPINDPSVQLDENVQVSGLIKHCDLYRRQIHLAYATPMPEELEAGKGYPCEVSAEPKGNSYALQLTYGYLKGTLRENDMTYGHSPILSNYQKGYKFRNEPPLHVLPRLESFSHGREEVFSLTPINAKEVVAQLGLNQQDSVTGSIIRANKERDNFSVVASDGRAFSFALKDFTFGSKRRPEMYPGNQIIFSRDAHKEREIKLTVKTISARFSMRPDLKQRNTWQPLDQVLPRGSQRECIYVGYQEREYLFEAAAGVVFALPISNIRRYEQGQQEQWSLLTSQPQRPYAQLVRYESSKMSYEICTGDFLTLFHRPDGTLQLLGYRPGRLHFAAEPGRFDTSPEAWMSVADRSHPIPLVGEILPFSLRGDIVVELTHLLVDEQRIPLRRGIRAIYKLRPDERQKFENNPLQKGEEVYVTLEKPFKLDSPQSQIFVRSISASERATVQSLREKLEDLDARKDFELFDGKIEYYDSRKRAFKIKLRELEDYADHKCWLPQDQISYNLFRSYNYSGAFRDMPLERFTLLYVNIYTADIQVSLIENPTWDIDDAGTYKGWFNGQILAEATFVGREQLDEAETEQEADATSTPGLSEERTKNQGEIVVVEIAPGFIIDVPSQNFLGHNFRLEQGDSMTLQVVELDGHFSLRVIRSLRARFNLLYDKQRVVSGRIKEVVDGKIRLEIPEIQGYTGITCFLRTSPDTPIEHVRNRLASYDLFRVVDCDRQKRYLYFDPLLPEDLREQDVLRVTYLGHRNNQGIQVTYGHNHAHTGFVYRSHISYKPDFDHRGFQTEQGKNTFDARVIRNDPNDLNRSVMLSIRDAGVQYFSYFLEDKEEFSRESFLSVLARKDSNKRWLDIEIRPGLVVHIPRERIHFSAPEQQQDLEKALPGDELEFLLEPNRTGLRLVRITKSFLHQLKPNTLVHAQLRSRSGKNLWKFALPEYSDREGELAADLDLFPEVLRDDLYLIVKETPRHPTAPVLLRQRTLHDRQLIVRVESIGAGGIYVRKENGQGGWVAVDRATYRTYDAVEYLRSSLPPGAIIIASMAKTRIKSESVLSLLENESLSLSRLPQFLQHQRETIEMAYVRTEGEHHIFEVRPGLFVRVPVAALYFYDSPIENFVERFYPGDVFTVTFKHTTDGKRENIGLTIQHISYSVFHHWQRFQRIQAEVKEILRGGIIAVVDSVGLIEQYVPEGDLILHSAEAYIPGKKIWLEVKYLNFRLEEQRRRVVLGEVEAPSLVDLKQEVKEGEWRPPLMLYGKIVRSDREQAIAEKEQITLDVLGQKVPVPLRYIGWSKAKNVTEILPVDEPGLWTNLYPGEKGNVLANPKQFQNARVRRLLKVGSIVPAQVVQINQDAQGKPKSVVLDVAGVFLLIANTDIVWGLPADLVGVKEHMWLAVRVQREEHFELVVSALEVSSTLKDMPVDKAFKAIVRFTLPHGLVFSHQGALGYIANESLTWSDSPSAEKLFNSGDEILVYKQMVTQQIRFSLKHASQLAGLKKGEELEAIVHAKTQEGIYIRVTSIAPSNMLALVPRDSISFEQWTLLSQGSPVILRLEDVNRQLLLISFYPLDDTVEVREDFDINEAEPLSALHDTFYLTSVQQFLKKINPKKDKLLESLNLPLVMQENGSNRRNRFRTSPVTKGEFEELLDEEKHFVDLLNKSHIPCTYHNIRILLGWLWTRTSGAFWERLAHLAKSKPWGNNKKEHSMIYVLCGVACLLKNIEMPDLPSEGMDLEDIDILLAYAVGITVLFEKVPQEMGFRFQEDDALDVLLNAYSYQKAAEIEVALLLINEAKRSFRSRNMLLQHIVQRFTQNPGWLLKLPKPAAIDVKSSSFKKGDEVPGINKTIDIVKSEVERILRTYFEIGEVRKTERLLEELWKKGQVGDEKVLPELSFNLALCRVLQGDLDGALRYLRRTGEGLPEERSRYSALRQNYFQLLLYVYYHSGKFAELQKFVTARFPQDSGPWLQTWLGYMLLASGKQSVSRELLEDLSTPSQEALLLHSYWLTREQYKSASLDKLDLLRRMMFQRFDEQGSSWEQPMLNVAFFPDIKILDRRRLVEEARKYNLPDYALNEFEKDANKPAWRELLPSLAELALRKPDLSKAQELLSASYSECLENHGLDIIERWIKSPDNHELLGEKLVTLLEESKQLSDRYWREPELRNQLWLAFELCQDYGSLARLLSQLPDDLQLDALEDVVSHLYLAGLQQHAMDITEDRFTDIAPDPGRQPILTLLLQNLQEMRSQELIQD